MKYTVEYTPQAVEKLRSLSPEAANLLYSWSEKNLNGCEDPRAQGKGKKSRGRWRYKVGAYRLVCEIEGDKIIILAITSDGEESAPSTGGHDHRGQVKRRAPSVFLKSTTRQPVKVAALLIVTALLAFAFVSRASEYLLIGEEIDRLSGFYRATGGLVEPGASTNIYNSLLQEPEPARDAAEAIRYLEETPYIKNVDVRQNVSAIIPTVAAGGRSDGSMSFSGPYEYVEDVLFYGTLLNVAESNNGTGHLTKDYEFNFLVDEVLIGTEFMIQEGKMVNLVNPRDYQSWEVRWGVGDPIDHFEYVDLADMAEALEEGGRYLLRASLDESKPGVMFGSGDRAPSLQVKPLLADGPWYVPVPEGAEADFDSPQLAGLLDEMKIYDDNQHSITVGVTSDMSAMVTGPEWQDAQVYLAEGRWLTAEDTAAGNRVCVIPQGLAEGDRTLNVGDTLTITLRDIAVAPYSLRTFFASIYGYLYQKEDLARLDEIEETSITADYEIVGTYGYVDSLAPGYMYRLYLPSSAVPETFSHYQETPEASMVTFELTGPEVQTAFLSESREELAKLGFQVSMLETGWENFQAAAQPMKQSSLYNALVFAAVMTAGLAVVAVVYFYMRRREIPIARAMGVPARTCVRQVTIPALLLVGIPGIALGSVYGWLWTAKNAGKTLAAFAGFEGAEAMTMTLPVFWLVLLGGAALLLLAGMVLLGAVVLVRRPVLELLQGAARAAAAEVGNFSPAAENPVAAPAKVQAVPSAAPVRSGAARKGKLGLRGGMTARFMWRQASRAQMKTALTIVLAAGFTVGLAAIQLAIAGSQERVNWLYENTTVEAELVPAGSYWGASIRRNTVESLQDSGYIMDFYLEATVSTGTGFVPYQEDWDGGGLHIEENELVSCGLLAFADERTFLSKAGSGVDLTITYHDGWNGALFAGTYTGTYSTETDERFPVIVPKEFYDKYELEPGSSIVIFSRSVRPFEVAGYYEGVVSGTAMNSILMPLSACQTACSGRLSYSKAHVTLDPALNRQLDRFEAALEEITSRQGVATLRAVIWDEELRQAVAPLEGGIRLMRVLYPVTLVLSILCAAGVSVLFIMTSAKEAAILRIQGTTKLRTQVMMGLQQTLTCFVGLVVGLAGVLLYVGSARPAMLAGIAASSGLCALAYLAAAAVGAIASSAVVTSKNPLELLQVRE